MKVPTTDTTTAMTIVLVEVEEDIFVDERADVVVDAEALEEEVEEGEATTVAGSCVKTETAGSTLV